MGFDQADRRRSGDSGRSGPVQSPVRPPGTRPPCVAAGASSQPQRKMQDKQGRDASSSPSSQKALAHPSPPPPRLSSYNPVPASGFVSPDRLRFPASPTPWPHRRAAAFCRLPTTVAPLRLRAAILSRSHRRPGSRRPTRRPAGRTRSFHTTRPAARRLGPTLA